MYRMNNEYTARGEQPIQGILCLDEEKAAGKLHYLAREWQYFPGKLLTPDMLKENTGYYSRYISIGEYGGMELGDKKCLSLWLRNLSDDSDSAEKRTDMGPFS